MKALKINLIFGALIGLFFFTSCDKEDADNTIASIKIFEEMTVELGSQMKLEAVVSGSSETQELGWLSYNPDFVSIDSDGNIEALKSGIATIKVYLLDKPEVFKKCAIIVNPDRFLGKWTTVNDVEVVLNNFEGQSEVTYSASDIVKLLNDTIVSTSDYDKRSVYVDLVRFIMYTNSIFEKDFSFTVGEDSDLEIEVVRGVYEVEVSDQSWSRSKEPSTYEVNYVEHHDEGTQIARETLVTLSDDMNSAVMSLFPFTEGFDIRVKLDRVE
ncbi:hypothetical protein EO244_11610 [Ancylomarina salipaludis]|uniref:BIG2 domain-containing protein n=1 Tax=Ancylomarina salipaludis TaxID=2501299 RepID=A0A4Q1JJW8_9BACT|nr:Ig-like domain-containing protein [Ancylomarina salipaludis]RXQ92189.1 hypothetical protein EO244_11610 [Ancylomarina salipaludis]